jgi:uncharacterized protein (TIGR03084 family)
MSTRLEEVLADLAVEGERLDALVAPLDEDGWRQPTPAEGWDVAHQIAHLAWTDEATVTAATDPRAWDRLVLEALADTGGLVDRAAARGAAAPAGVLLERWRASRARLGEVLGAVPAGTKLPWFGPPMSATSMATARFMETWAHARDVAEALRAELPADDGVRHVVHLGVRARDFAFGTRGLEPPVEPFAIELVLPSGTVLEHGEPSAAQSVRGSAYDFALLVTQRVHRTDTDLVAVGADADRWLDIAQAFAGPPGTGRAPR